MGYNSQGYSTPTIHHDALTLEILAEPLRMLDKEWRDGASMLRQIWTNVLTKNKNNFRKHVPVVVNLVWFADSLSAATYKENSAFSSSPEWKRYSRLQDVSFWRPSADNYMDRAA